MNELEQNLIQHTASVIEAMKKLNNVPLTLTLFVLDDDRKMVGTLTDGDIRRGFIRGLTLNDPVSRFMLTKFHSIRKGFTVYDFKAARALGVRLLPVLDENNCITQVYDLKKKKSILPLECVIMAGGRGERLRPLTDEQPKPLLPLGDKPIIEHIIDRLISYGIGKFYIAVRYRAQQIIDYLGDGSSKGVSIEYIREEQQLGTAGALSLASGFGTEHLLVMNSDLFTDADFEDLYMSVLEQNAALGAATVPYTTKVPYGIFTTEENRITGLKEKPTYTSYANAGIYILNKKVIEKIPHNTFFNITDLMEQLILEGEKVIHNPIVGYWIDIGQHQDYLNAQEIVRHLKNEK